MKKIEIIIEKRHLDPLAALLEETGISGYTVLEIVKGFGKTHGKTYDLGVVDLDKNFFVITLCNAQEYEILKETIVPYIKEYEGFVYAYDVELL